MRACALLRMISYIVNIEDIVFMYSSMGCIEIPIVLHVRPTYCSFQYPAPAVYGNKLLSNIDNELFAKITILSHSNTPLPYYVLTFSKTVYTNPIKQIVKIKNWFVLYHFFVWIDKVYHTSLDH